MGSIKRRTYDELKNFQNHLSNNTIERNDLYNEFHYLTQYINRYLIGIESGGYYGYGYSYFTIGLIELFLVINYFLLSPFGILVNLMFIIGLDIYNRFGTSYHLHPNLNYFLNTGIRFKNIGNRFKKYRGMYLMDSIHMILILGLGILCTLSYTMILTCLGLYMINRSHNYPHLYLKKDVNCIVIMNRMNERFYTNETYYDLEEYLHRTMPLLGRENSKDSMLGRIRNFVGMIKNRLFGYRYFKGSRIEEAIDLSNELRLDLERQLISTGHHRLLGVLRREGREVRVDWKDRRIIDGYHMDLNPNDGKDQRRIHDIILDLYRNLSTFNEIWNLAFRITLREEIEWSVQNGYDLDLKPEW